MNMNMSIRCNLISSEEAVAGHEDLLLQILLLLPAKQLVRLKLVSRLWSSLISDAKFSHKYSVRKLNSPPSGLLIAQIHPTNDLILAWLEDVRGDKDRIEMKHKYLKFIHGDCSNSCRPTISFSCNGLSLFCLSCQRSDPQRDYFVCNLTTKKFKKIPSPGRDAYTEAYVMALAFDPLKSPHYKVVYFAGRGNLICETYTVRIYSSETCSWKDGFINLDTIPLSFPGHYSGVFWRNTIYWFSDTTCFYIDMDNECLRTKQLVTMSGNIGVSYDHLYLVYHSPYLVFNVYEMEEECLSIRWCPKYTINLRSEKISPSFLTVQSIIWDNHGSTGLTLVLQISGCIILYNPKAKKFYGLLDQADKHSRYWYSSHQHFDTLFSV